MAELSPLDRLTAEIRSSAKYRALDEGLVRRIGAQELEKGRSFKEAVKAARARLHQAAGAYQEQGPDIPRALAELVTLPTDRQDPAVKAYCRGLLARHASTAERLPFIEEFYARLFTGLEPVHSLLDLGCGLNPLALPWMPLEAGVEYTAGDVYPEIASLLTAFFQHVGQNGSGQVCDLTAAIPAQRVDVVLALKIIPCLEQLDKSIGRRLLEGLDAKVIIASFPARSLGGREKGMAAFYDNHLRELLAGKDWPVETLEFGNETVYRIHKVG